MANGVRSTDLDSAASIDEFLGNRDGSMVRVGLSAATAQMLADAGLQNVGQDVAALKVIGAAGMSPRAAVACATSGHITLSGEQTIDGVATNASRVLVKSQTNAAQNGIYISSPGSWSRAGDMDAPGEFVGASVYVSGGSANAGKTFYTASTVAAVGADPVVWLQVEDQSHIATALADVVAVRAVAVQGKAAGDQLATGRSSDLIEGAEFGYILKADGAESAYTTSWKRTGFLAVTPDTVILKDDQQTIGSGSSAAAIAYYDANFVYLGHTAQPSRSLEVKVGDAYPAARHVRLTFNATGAYNSARLKRPGIYNSARRELAAIGGMAAVDPRAKLGTYINKDTGAEVTASSFGCSGFISVSAETVLVRDASYIEQNSSVAPIAFYDAEQAYLGFFRPVDRAERVVVGDAFPDARHVRYCWLTAEHETKNLYLANPASAGALEQLTTALQRDYLLESTLTNHWVNESGVFNSASSWRTTDLIPVREGQVFVFDSDVVGSSGVAHVSAWDVSEEFVGSLLTGDNTSEVYNEVRVEIPAGVAYVRASFAVTGARNSFKGVSSGAVGGSAASAISALVPSEAYARQGEALYMYARGIVADRSLDLAWDVSEANSELCVITPGSTADIPVTLKARGADNIQRIVGSFSIRVTGTPLNPAAARNVICLGDSLTLGVSNAGIEGAYPNELSRRLTGVGTALLSGAQSPAPLALSSFKFRGTLGDQPVKHEGRGGWDADRYLGQQSGNAFWNAATGQFDLAHYLTNNGFDSGATADGVDGSGSNLTMVILLGWNDVYNETAAASAASMEQLIDRIHAARPATDVILVGLNPAPELNQKSFAGSRFVSQREVFEGAVRQLGEAYRDLAASKANTEFLQISHVFNPEVGYQTGTKPLNGRTSLTQTGATDHVHPNATGYAMIADAIFYKLLHKYCR